MKKLPLIKKMREKESGSTWNVTYNRFKPAQEGLREALCTLGNGYLATRGAAAESSASRIHYPGTYMAGMYNKLGTRIAGKTIYNEDFVNCPNWLGVVFRTEKGEWHTPATCKIMSYHQELDIKKGVLRRKMLLQDSQGRRTLVENKRIVSMDQPHCVALQYSITPENYEGKIELRVGLDGAVKNTGVARYRELKSNHLAPLKAGSFGRNGISLLVETTQSKVSIAQAARITLYSADVELHPKKKIIMQNEQCIMQEFTLTVQKQKQYTIEKVVGIYTSKDKGVRKPLPAAIALAKRPVRFNALLRKHRKAWETLWKKYDIKIEGDSFSQLVMRLHAFHLMQSGSMHNTKIDAGILARGLHGEAYRGHVFWDELFIAPFYDFHEPAIMQAFLLYRYRRLGEARQYAKATGYKGSMFPWQSGSTGVEETQVIHLNPLSGKWDPDDSCIQRHVSFAIAYNVWQHWIRTNDTAFMQNYGIELMLSIAQFGASLATYNPKTKRYHTEGLMGPDEFHEKLPGASKAGFKDNAYTNFLISWTLMKAEKALQLIPKVQQDRIMKKVGITRDDIAEWNTMSRKMNIIINKDGIISQFDGYFKLKELNWEKYKNQYANIQRMDRILKAEGKSPNDYKVAKQADALMMFYLLPFEEIQGVFSHLGYTLDKNSLKRNYDFYVKRTSHGSTLSKVVHCYISHILGREKEAWEWFQEVLRSDINDTQGGTTPEGIHSGVMSGSLDIVLRGFAGAQVTEDALYLTPKLPKQWGSLKLRFLLRGTWISLIVTSDHVLIRFRNENRKRTKVPVCVYGTMFQLVPGKTHKIRLKKSITKRKKK